MTTPPDLYERDFYAWTQEQAAKLRAGELIALDLGNLAEELEDMGKSRRHALQSHLEELLLHLLKWQYQSERRNPGWEISIDKQRAGLEDLLADSPSLKPRLVEAVPKAYHRARRYAAKETGLPPSTFPDTCPYTAEQALDEDFWP